MQIKRDLSDATLTVSAYDRCRTGLRANKRPFAMIGSTALSHELEFCSAATDLVALHLHLMHLVVILDTEASDNREPVAAK